MDNLSSEILPHIDRVLNNSRYCTRTKLKFLEDVVAYISARTEDLKIEQEQTELLEYPDEMH